MTLAPRRMRVPGRKRFGGIFSGDTATFVVMFGGGFLFTAFFRVDSWRLVLFGQSHVDFPAVLGLLALCCAVGWRSLLRRGFAWAEPAELTWLDFAPVDRGRIVALRLLGAWAGVVAVVGYLAALMLAVGGSDLEDWRAALALIVACFVLGFVTARRTALRADVAGPLVLAGLGVVIATARLGPVVVEVIAAGILLAAVPLAFGGEAVTRAGRTSLLAGWDARVLRSVAVTFLDPMMLLPSSAPVGGFSLRRPTAVRLAWAGTVGRSRYAGAAVLLAAAVVVGHVALPTLPGPVLIGLGSYVALTPFAGGLGVLWRNPGRRRWLGSSDRELIVTHGLVLAAVALAWSVLPVVLNLVTGTALAASAWIAVPLAVLSVLRTVTRKPMDYGTEGFIDTPMGPMPANLTRQLFRGPDLLVVGVALLCVIT